MALDKGRVLGIDLGTTNSVMAVIEGDQPMIIPNAEGGRVTPSVVAFTTRGECLVGQIARRQAVLHPARTIASIKRRMGTDAIIPIDDQAYTPAQISSLILGKLKQDAEQYLGEAVTRAVITVPAYFSDAQRQATKYAGELAGLEVPRIINEPTAAALAYGMGKARREKVLVWDMGGGTFDVSILDIGEGVFEVRATSGDAALGGDDYDRRIVDHLAQIFQQEHGFDPRLDRQALQRLLDAAERAKIELTSLGMTPIALPYLTADATGPHHLELELNRATFEQLTDDLTERTREPFQQALTDAHLEIQHLDQVVLVGGATRMPAIGRLVRKLTGKQPNQGVNPDEVVALGAAIQGGVLTGQVRDVLLLDVTPFSLGVEVMGGRMRRLVDRNTPLPFRRTERFTTNYDKQRDVQVHVLQGESDASADNISLGRFRLDGIPPALRGVPRIAVSFDIDVNGIVHVAATDEATGTSQGVTLAARRHTPPIVPDVQPEIEATPTFILDPRLRTRPHPTTTPHPVVDTTLAGPNRRGDGSPSSLANGTSSLAVPPFSPGPHLEMWPPSAVIARADALIAQAQSILAHSQPTAHDPPALSFFERSATESALDRLIQARQRIPLDDASLALACDDLERLSQHIAQWPGSGP